MKITLSKNEMSDLAQMVANGDSSSLFTFHRAKDGEVCLTVNTDKSDAYRAGQLDAYLHMVDVDLIGLHDVPRHMDIGYEDVVYAFQDRHKNK